MKDKSLFIPLVLSALLLGACSENDGSPAAATPAQIDPIIAEKWCSLNTAIFDFPMIERYSFEIANNKVGIEYFTLDTGSQPKLYQVPWKSSWLKGTASAVGYAVELNARDIGKSGEEVDQLEKIQATLQKRYPNLKKPLQKLDSVDTLKITHSGFLSSQSDTKTAFPCSTISASLTAIETTNPFIEFSVLLHQAVLAATPSSSFANQVVFLAAPITPLLAQDEKLAGTSWCAIKYLNKDFIWLEVLSFGQNRFITSVAAAFTKHFPAEDMREIDRNGSLDTPETSIFEIVSMDEGVLGERPSPWLQDVKDRRYFTLARDSSGVRALMRGSEIHRSPALSTSASNTFFDCSRPLPFLFEKEYRSRLSHFITRLREKL